MPRTVYALLVAIDEYPAGISRLHGCANDIDAVADLLNARVPAAGDALELRILKNAEATRERIIAGFQEHLTAAGPDDVALFFYSGHGSQAPTPPEFWHLEPDRLDETLVCFNSRQSDTYDLADKELAKLIAQVAEKKPHIVIILDCCHSGSGTRAVLDGVVRRAPTDNRQRPLTSYLVTPAEATTLAARAAPPPHAAPAAPTARTAPAAPTNGLVQPAPTNGAPSVATGQAAPAAGAPIAASDWAFLPQGRHLLLAGCRSDEEAKEHYVDGRPRGVFSTYLIETLQTANVGLTYRDLFKRVDALVRAYAAQQSPQVEATDSQDLDLPFLGGLVGSRPAYFTVTYSDEAADWIIDGGAVHGIAPIAGDETTTLALFPHDSPLDELRAFKHSIGQARVTAVQPTLSTVALTLASGQTPPDYATYRAVITGLPLPPLGVRLNGDSAGLALIRQALATAGPAGGPSLFVRADDAQPGLELTAADNSYRIGRLTDARALVVPVAHFTPSSARLAVQRLEQIVRWSQIARLTNPSSSLPVGAVQLTLYQVQPAQGGLPERLLPLAAGVDELRFEYRYLNDTWQPPQFKIRLLNTSQRRLYCALLDLTPTFKIDASLLKAAGLWLEPAEEAWALDGKTVYATVPDALWRQGVSEITDLLKLIVSTEQFDATLLEQPELDVATRGQTRAGGAVRGTLNRLMQRAQTRNLGGEPATDETIPDWIASELSLTTVRPQASVVVSQAGAGVPLGAGVTLLPHPTLAARARLTSAPQASRAVGNETLPPLLRDHPALVVPFEFTVSRAGGPGLSVLELTGVKDHTVVTPAQPLRLRVMAPLAPGEQVLALGYDGEFYWPLGNAQQASDGTTELRLDRLPAPLGTRDLFGSIRIFFQKVIGQRLGLHYPYPLLSAVTLKEDGGVEYDPAPAAVAARVAAATRIVLYIHGIIGDTQGMVRSARGLASPAIPGLSEQYECLLAFDYENIHTPIPETARALKERLAAVGLGAGHGKTLHIVAHSMGGLVARWLIEREGGQRLVGRLMMLGTPNAGSPWSTLQDWATTVLTLGLNGLAASFWPAGLLAGLVGAIEKSGVTLNQMNPNSELLKELAGADDPAVPYVILAGNTSLITPAEPAAASQTGRLGQLLDRLKQAGLRTVFFNQPNDIAVTVTSIGTVPANRQPAPVLHTIACDHLTYFSSEVGLKQLAEAALAGRQRGAGRRTRPRR